MNRSLLFLLFLFLFNGVFSQKHFSESKVWFSGEDSGIAQYFVYGLAVANDGSVLAFSEGRHRPGDTSPHDIVLKRSKDGGHTWLPSQILLQSRNSICYTNPTPVVDTKTGNIVLFFAQNYDNQSSDIFYITSYDNGYTWSATRKVTSLFDSDPLKRPFHLPGPGHGISLKNGRMLIQVWHRFSVKLPINQRQYGVSVIYSDDFGKSWRAGGYLPQSDSFPANESRLVQLPSGDILLDSRSAIGVEKKNTRIQSISRDGGITWAHPYFGTIPRFTLVDAGLNKIKVRGKTYLLFTHPIGRGRNDLAISLSKNNGKTWLYTRLVCKGPSTYSDVVVLPDKSILVLVGRDGLDYVSAIKFDLKWVKTGNKFAGY